MRNLKRSFSALALAGVIGLTSVAANAGIIIVDFNKQTKSDPCAPTTEKSLIGIIIVDLVGIIVADRTGIIIVDRKSDDVTVNCGIIIVD
jgi:predicted ATPase